MLAKLVRDFYSRIPIVGDYVRLSDSLEAMHELNRELTDHVAELAKSAGAIQLALNGLSQARQQLPPPDREALLELVRELRTTAGDIAKSQREIIGMLWLHQTRDVIELTDFTLHHHPRYSDPARLLRFAAQVNSQNGEDGMIHEIFRRIGTTNRVFAEIGCGNGKENNTAFLLSQGWTGFWIDGEDGYRKSLEGRTDLQGDCLKCITSFVTGENVVDLLRNLGVPAEFDLLSIDIDQNTYYVWESLEGYRPRVAVIEYNSSMPSDVDWKVRYDPSRTWDGSTDSGASLKSLEILGRRLGYCLVGCDITGTNAFFVRSELVADLFAEPFTSENHHEPPRNALLSRRGQQIAILDRMSDTASSPMTKR